MRQRIAGRDMAAIAPEGTIPFSREGAMPALESTDLFRGGREVIIRHGGEQYRLRLTSSNKLILIK
jgi:hemin uptake protein HemP